MVELLFLAVQRDCLRFVIVVFPDHTHLLFFIFMEAKFCINKPLQFGKITLPITGVGKSCPCQEFFKLQIYLLMLFAKMKLSHFF